MRRKYREWMYRWEHALTTRDTNRIVRPFEWGLEWAEHWPVVGAPFKPSFGLSGVVGAQADHGRQAEIQRYWFGLNDRIVEHSDEFYGYARPTDFRLEQRAVR